jgi:hypothetical protein
MYYLLYEITNLVNGKTYIGQHITKNIEDGYMGTNKPSLETKTKMSIARKGRKTTAETIARISAAHKGKKLSVEHIAKREETKRKNGTNKHNPETIAKISATLKGIKRPPRTLEHIAKIQETKRKNGTTLKGIKRSPEILKKSWETRRKKQLLNNK